MSKSVSLVTLIAHSLVLPDEIKLALLDVTPDLSDEEVAKLGKQLASEVQFALQNESYIKEYAKRLIDEFKEPTNTVYVSSGKPN